MNKTQINEVKKKISFKFGGQELGMMVALVVLFVALAIFSPVFLTLENLMNILRQISIVAIIAVGGFLIVLIGGMDISVGSVAALSGVVLAICTMQLGMNVWIGAIMGLIVGSLVGLVNGLLITFLKLPSFIITLATMQIAKGLAFVISGGQAISGFPEEFLFLGRGYIWIIPIPVIIMIAVFLLMNFIIKKTKFGVHVYAIGGSWESARIAGIKANKISIILYVLGGLFAAVSGTILASRLNSGTPNVGANFMFEAFTAIILGGVSMSGGEGNLAGVFIGSVFIGILSNGMSLLNLDSYFQMIIQGVVLTIAVATQAVIILRGAKVKRHTVGV